MKTKRLNKRVTIQKISIKNNNGFEEEVVEFEKTLWAGMENIFGKEKYESESLKYTEKRKAIIRYLKELDVSINKNASIFYKLIYKNNVFNIINITNISEKNSFLELELENIWD